MTILFAALNAVAVVSAMFLAAPAQDDEHKDPCPRGVCVGSDEGALQQVTSSIRPGGRSR